MFCSYRIIAIHLGLATSNAVLTSMLATYIAGCCKDPCFGPPSLCSCHLQCFCNKRVIKTCRCLQFGSTSKPSRVSRRAGERESQKAGELESRTAGQPDSQPDSTHMQLLQLLRLLLFLHSQGNARCIPFRRNCRQRDGPETPDPFIGSASGFLKKTNWKVFQGLGASALPTNCSWKNFCNLVDSLPAAIASASHSQFCTSGR